MPIYEYECTGCGKHHEIIQKISEKPLVKCPQCAGRLQRLISQSAFHLKGSGWYATDYAKKSSDSPSPPKKREEKAPATSSKTESKDSE
jgi:putative FmdB family regulatory protein